MFSDIDFVLEHHNLISVRGSVSYDSDGFSVDVMFDGVKYKLDVRRLGSLSYQYSVSGAGCSEKGTFSLASEWILGYKEKECILNAIRYRRHPSLRMFDGFRSEFCKSGYDVEEYRAITDGFTAKICCVTEDGLKKAVISITLRGLDSYSYLISVDGSGSVSGTFSNATQWELTAADAGMLLKALNGVMIHSKSSEVPEALHEKPADFRDILSELLRRITSIVEETQCVVEEYRSLLQK